MSDELHYLAYTGLQVAMLLYSPETSGLLILDEDPNEYGEHEPKLFETQDTRGRFVYAYGFREPEKVNEFLKENYHSSDLPFMEPIMRRFLRHVSRKIKENGHAKT